MNKHLGFTLRGRREGAVAAAVVTAVLAVGLSQAISQTPNFKLASSSVAVHVASNHLVDASGATVTLHGVDLSATEFACDEGGGPTNRGWSIYGSYPLDQASTYAAMAAWHVQVVRVPLNEDCWLNINGVNPAYGGANYQAAIAAEVSMINEAGMTAILDLHWSAPGQYAAIDQQPMADADHSITFWSQVATAYRNDPAVIYDLYNEPFLYGNYFTNPSQDPWLCWLNGCSLNQFVSANQIDMNGNTTGYLTSYTWKTAGMQTLIDTIRGTGADQPVLVNGLDWANDDFGLARPRSIGSRGTDDRRRAHLSRGDMSDVVLLGLWFSQRSTPSTQCWWERPAITPAHPSRSCPRSSPTRTATAGAISHGRGIRGRTRTMF